MLVRTCGDGNKGKKSLTARIGDEDRGLVRGWGVWEYSFPLPFPINIPNYDDFKEKRDNEKSLVICYEYKMFGHFKSKCLKLEKTKDKKKSFNSKSKK